MRFDRVIHLIGCHAEGMRGDVVVGGLPHVPGASVLEKQNYFETHLDDLRRIVNFEPRGDISRAVNFIVPATNPRAAFGFIIGEATEYPVMSGSNAMCVATVLLETGMHPMTEPVTEFVLESASGLIAFRCECRDGKVIEVSFLNQPAFVYHRDARVDLEGHGDIILDVAWGGMTYAIVPAESFGFGLTEDEAADIALMGQKVKAAAAEQLKTVHPLEPAYAGITQTQFTGPLRTVDDALVARNAVVYSPGLVDRSPCGTGTSARLALMHARGEIVVGQPFIHESLIGTRFTSSIEETTRVGEYPAVRPRVAGQAWITSMEQIGVDPTDPFQRGFTLGDLW